MYYWYMQEYVEAAYQDMDRYFREEGAEEGSERKSVYKINYYLRDHLQKPFVSDKLRTARVQDQLMEFTGKFMDEHSVQLSTAGPVHIFMFGNAETEFLYKLFGISADQLLLMFEGMVKETFYGNISSFFRGWVKHAPHKLLLTAILIDALQNGYEEIVEACEYLWAFCEYPIIYRMFWRTGVKEDVMNYTVEHLSSKFKVKKVQTLQGLLKYDAHSSVSCMADRLKDGADHTYTDFMYRIRNQIKNTFKNISRAYYDNDKANATQHTKGSHFDDGSLVDQEGVNTNVAQVVDKTVNKFAIGGINSAMVRVAADGSQVDKDNLAGYINQINATKNNRMPKLVENIITSYFNRNPTDTTLSGSEFLNFGLALYRSIGTSKDPLYQEIKAILNYWMHDIIGIQNYYHREGTIINYTRAVFNYVVLMINYFN